MPLLTLAARFLLGFAILLAALFLGDLAARFLPVPGSLIGMVLLFVFLTFHHGAAARAVTVSGDFFLKYLAFFFVPAGVGVIVHATDLGAHWFAVAASLLISSALSLIATAYVMKLLVSPAP